MRGGHLGLDMSGTTSLVTPTCSRELIGPALTGRWGALAGETVALLRPNSWGTVSFEMTKVRMGKLKGVVIGCGAIAREHLTVLREFDNVEVVAVCDISAARAEAAAERFGIAR